MDKEVNHNTQALAYTLVIYSIVLVLCYLTYISIPYTQTQIEQGGIEVNYGNSDQGMGNDYTNKESPSTSPKIKTKISNAVKSPQIRTSSPITSNEKEIRTQNNEEADAVKSAAHSTKKTGIAFQSSTNSSPRPPKVNTNALYKGPSYSGNGGGDGNTGQPGNQGSPNGSVLSRNYSGTGTGGGGIALILAGSKFVGRPTIEDDGQTEGKVFVTISVDKEGNVISAEAGGRGTTIQNEALWRKCENAATRAKLNPITSGPDIRTGRVIFSFKLL